MKTLGMNSMIFVPRWPDTIFQQPAKLDPARLEAPDASAIRTPVV